MPDNREILEQIYHGVYNLDNLPPEIYLNNTSKFINGINKGFGVSLAELTITDAEYALVNGFYQNINKFTGAKLYHQVNDTMNFITNASGTRRNMDAFLKEAQRIDDLYNRTWLTVENDAITKRADDARLWRQYENEKELFPYLRYVTVGDSRVRPHHAALDGVTKPVDDPFWNTYSPILDFGCRCLLEQLEQAKITEDSELNLREIDKEVSPLFRNNPARSGVIFMETGAGKHPYFKAPQEKINRNFGFGTINDYLKYQAA